METYFWEFFGRESLATARHFERHLLEFLAKHQLRAVETGTVSGPGQALCFASADEETGKSITTALRPAHHAEGPLPAELRALLAAPEPDGS